MHVHLYKGTCRTNPREDQIKSQPRQTQVETTGNGSSTAKRSAKGVSVTCPPR